MATISSFSDTSKDKIKILAAEFITLRMAMWLSEKKDLTTINKFNQENNIGISKFLLFPFFTCIANGSFNLLYDLFNPFYAMENGPVSNITLNLVVKNNSEYFDLDDKNYSNIKVRSLLYSSLGEINSEIRNKQIEMTNGVYESFENISYDDESGKTIVDSILSSIEAIKKQTDDGFILFDDYQMTTLARQHKSWSTIYYYYNDLPNSSLNDFIIPKEEAEKDRKVFKSLEQLETR